jgi:hypothetical protein
MRSRMLTVVVVLGSPALATAQWTDVYARTDLQFYAYSPYSVGTEGRLHYNPYPGYAGADGYYYSTYDPGRTYSGANWSYLTTDAARASLYSPPGYPSHRFPQRPGTTKSKPRAYYNVWY